MPADVPKALVGAAILRDKARPEWPDGSSMSALVTAAAAAAAGADAHEYMPPTAYRELTAACWDHEARARWAASVISCCPAAHQPCILHGQGFVLLVGYKAVADVARGCT